MSTVGLKFGKIYLSSIGENAENFENLIMGEQQIFLSLETVPGPNSISSFENIVRAGLEKNEQLIKNCQTLCSLVKPLSLSVSVSDQKIFKLSATKCRIFLDIVSQRQISSRF